MNPEIVFRIRAASMMDARLILIGTFGWWVAEQRHGLAAAVLYAVVAAEITLYRVMCMRAAGIGR